MAASRLRSRTTTASSAERRFPAISGFVIKPLPMVRVTPFDFIDN
jgi:hypothetical protein